MHYEKDHAPRRLRDAKSLLQKRVFRWRCSSFRAMVDAACKLAISLSPSLRSLHRPLSPSLRSLHKPLSPSLRSLHKPLSPSLRSLRKPLSPSLRSLHRLAHARQRMAMGVCMRQRMAMGVRMRQRMAMGVWSRPLAGRVAHETRCRSASAPSVAHQHSMHAGQTWQHVV